MVGLPHRAQWLTPQLAIASSNLADDLHERCIPMMIPLMLLAEVIIDEYR